MARRRLSMDTPLIPLSPALIESPNIFSTARRAYDTAPSPHSPTWTEEEDLQDSEKLVEGEPGGYRLLAGPGGAGGSGERVAFSWRFGTRHLLFAIAAACVLISAAIFYRETAQNVWSNVAMELGGGESEPSSCGTAEVMQARRDSAFWVAEVGSKCALFSCIRPSVY